MTSPVLPRTGLDELLQGWTGDGELVNALAVSRADDRDWTSRDIRQRGQRVALGRLSDMLIELPQSQSEWWDALPPASQGFKNVSRMPSGSVRWSETFRRHRWPPEAFVSRHRRRMTDETAVTVLTWLSERLTDYKTACQSSPSLAHRVFPSIDAMCRAVADLENPTPICPDRADLYSLRSSGKPWPLVARIADVVASVDRDPEFLAYEFLYPEPELGYRLFHLNVFGEILRAIRQAGFRRTWLSPVGGTRSGPRLRCVDPVGISWDLWFEASAARRYYGLHAGPYSDATNSIEGSGGPIGADVALVSCNHHAALLLECKWSDKPTYVARDGFHQAVSYAVDARDGLAETVWSFVVGPEEFIQMPNLARQLENRWSVVLGSVSCGHVSALLEAFRRLDPMILET